jgi:hypothetical protein
MPADTSTRFRYFGGRCLWHLLFRFEAGNLETGKHSLGNFEY